MSIYYQDDLVTLHHGDCREIDAWQSADVLCMDPPYGIAYRSGSRREKLAASIVGDQDTSIRDGILEAWGSKPALVFGSPRIPRPAGWKMVLVWDKGGALGMGDLSIPWKPGHEEIYVLGKGGWRGNRTSDVIRCAPVQSTAANGRLHPHQKPVSLMAELVSKLPHGVVADPTAGVGSTLVAAASLGQRAIGVEVDEGYCEQIAKRLERGQRGLDLYGGAA